MIHPLDRRHLKKRYFFQGGLVLDTALHIGTGRAVSPVTDSPVLRDASGLPVIPGSSIKGVFRSTVERIAPNLPGFRTCSLEDDVDDCLSPQNGKLGDAYRTVRGYRRRVIPKEETIKGDEEKQAFDALKMLEHPEWAGEIITDVLLLTLLDEHLCDTCKLFGSPHMAARASFSDMHVNADSWLDVCEIRDGVGIDRDSERAVDQVKFDFEVVPSGTAFSFGMILENPADKDLAMAAVGLSELMQGMARLGGIKSRGLGACRLNLAPVRVLDYTDPNQLARYLTAGIDALDPVSPDIFITDAIKKAIPAA